MIPATPAKFEDIRHTVPEGERIANNYRMSAGLSATNRILLHLPNDYESVQLAFERFGTFVEFMRRADTGAGARGPEDVRAQLQQLAYPLFLHTFVGLVEVRCTRRRVPSARYHVADPENFLRFYRPFFDAQHQADIDKLAACKTLEQLAQCDVVQALRTRRTEVRISRATYDLALAFLYEHSASWLLAVVFNHVSVVFTDTLPVLPQATPGVTVPQVLSLIERQKQLQNASPQTAPATPTQAAAVTPQTPVPGPDAGQIPSGETAPQSPCPSTPQIKTEGAPATTTTQAVMPPQSPSMTPPQPQILQQQQQQQQQQPMSPVPKPIAVQQTQPVQQVMGVHASMSGTPQGVHAQTPVRRTVRVTIPSVCCTTLRHTGDSLQSLAIHPSGSMVAGGFAEAVVRLWPTTSTDTPPTELLQRPVALHGVCAPVTTVAFPAAADTVALLAGSSDGAVRLWQLDTQIRLVCYKGHAPGEPVWHVASNPGGYYFVSCSRDRTARVWATNSVVPARVLVGHAADVTTAAFHPNGAYLATGSADHTVRLWSIGDGCCVRVFAPAAGGHAQPVTAVAFSPSGRMLASASVDGQVRLWDIASGRRQQRFVARAGWPVHCLRFSPDSTCLAAGGADGSVRFWSTAPEHPAADDSASPQPPPLCTLYTRNTPIYTMEYLQRTMMVAGPQL